MEYFDSTMLTDYQKCPQLYQYKHVLGYRKLGDNMDLLFGSLLGEALERFEKALLHGVPHDTAHTETLDWVLANSIDSAGTHRFGKYVPTWRCLGSTPYKNDKGNPAKCPYSHKGKYFPAPSPELCSCGSQTENVLIWVPHKASKDLSVLIELLVTYFDAARDRALKPISLEGKPALEHFWEMDFCHTDMQRPARLCGNLDAIKSFGPEHYIIDYKTTSKSLDARYWATYMPNIQVDLYNMAAETILPDHNIKGVVIEAFSTPTANTAFKVIKATDGQKAEMANDTGYWLGALQRSLDQDHWPRNRASCFGCPFQPVCSREPEAREAILNEKYEKDQIWNPKTRTVETTGTPSPSTPNSTQKSTPPSELSPGSTSNSLESESSMSSMTGTSGT